MRPQAPRLQFCWEMPVGIYVAISVAMLAAFAITIGLWALDARLIDGVSVWAKPLKFELALAVHAATLALVAARLGQPLRTGFFMRAVALAFLAACVVEMGWILAQAAQGQHSHFNDSTAFHRAMFSVMAFCAILITGAAGAVALAVWRNPDFAAAGAIRAGVVLGLMGGAVLTMVTAFAIGGRGSPYVGGRPDSAARLMMTGWSLSGGDLRVAHFLATHMLQAIPIAAILAARLANPRAALRIVVAAAALWSGWTLVEFRNALNGNASIMVGWFV